MTLTEAEAWFIKQVLEDAQGRVELAAIRLGISRSALYNKIKKHGLGTARS
jgi:transcriptional regulator of acetoin/glycerol metabolism